MTKTHITARIKLVQCLGIVYILHTTPDVPPVKLIKIWELPSAQQQKYLRRYSSSFDTPEKIVIPP